MRRTKRITWMLAALAMLALAGPAWGQNDFSTDTACVALWRLENGALGTDSKGGNTLTNSTAVAATGAGNFQQGAASADFESGDPDYMECADASLDAGFPLKNGDATKKISVAFWMKPESLPAASGWMFMVAKYHSIDNKRSLYVGLNNNAGTTYIQMAIGHTGGTTSEGITFAYVAISAGQWYHVGVTFDDATKAYQIQVYDLSADTRYYTSGATTNNINVEDASWRLGSSSGGTLYYDGLLDEVAVFNDILTVTELAAIQAGTYTGQLASDLSTDSACVADWNFESGALGTDSKGSNTLTVTNAAAHTGNFIQGSTSATFAAANSTMTCVDGSLDAGFPGKNGTTNRDFSLCFWLYANYETKNVIWKGSTASSNSTFRITQNIGEGGVHLQVYLTDDGTTEEAIYQGLDWTIEGKWVHFGITYNNSTGAWRIRSYNATSGAAQDDSGTLDAGFGDLFCGDGTFTVGGSSFTGLMDELVVFNDVLTADEIDKIRAGTYGPEVGSLRRAWWWRRRHEG